MDFKTLQSRRMFNGRAVKVWLEEVQYPDGRQVSIEVVRHPGSVTILPVDEAGRIWFVRQYRHPAGQMLLELPAGTLEPDEAPVVTAAREIREEIGMAADTLIPLGSFYIAPGYSDEFMHTYLAIGLSPDALAPDDGEYIQVEKLPIPEVFAMFERGEIADMKSVAVLALARDRLLSNL